MSARSPLAFKPYLFFSASLPARISAPGALLRHAAGMPSGGGPRRGRFWFARADPVLSDNFMRGTQDILRKIYEEKSSAVLLRSSRHRFLWNVISPRDPF